MADARQPNQPPRVRQIAGPLERCRLGAAQIPVRIRCDTIHIADHHTFAVIFIRLDEDTCNRIEHAIDRQPDSPAGENAAVIDREPNDD